MGRGKAGRRGKTGDSWQAVERGLAAGVVQFACGRESWTPATRRMRGEVVRLPEEVPGLDSWRIAVRVAASGDAAALSARRRKRKLEELMAAAESSEKDQNAQTAGQGPLLTRDQLTHLEKRLREEREKALRGLGRFAEAARAAESGDTDVAGYTDHMADQGTEAMEREKAALFATKEGRYLYRIEEALRRLYNDPDNFGRCHATGKPIGFHRLDALPHARYCIEYKRELEATGG